MISRTIPSTSRTRPGPAPGRVYIRRILVGLASTATVASASIAAAKAGEPIDIALATPLTGRHAGFGAAQRTALEQAVAALNVSGGIANRFVRLSVHDDGCARDTAMQAASAISTDTAARPIAVIGHPCPSAALAAAPIYRKAGVVFLSAGSRHPAITDQPASPLVFRVSGRDDRQGNDAAVRLRALAGKDGGVVMVHDRTSMARAIVGAAARALMSAAAGGAPAPPSIGIVAGEADYAKAVREVAAARPSAILFAGFPAEAAILLRQLRAASVGAPLLLSDANASAELAAHAGALLDDRVEVMMPVAASVAQSNLATDEPASTPEAIAARDAQTAFEIVATAARSEPSLSSAALAKALSASAGAVSPWFDTKGDAITPSFAPYRWRDRAWRRVR